MFGFSAFKAVALAAFVIFFVVVFAIVSSPSNSEN
jgi:hypothetical protein